MKSIFQKKLAHELPIEQSDVRYYLIDTKKYRPSTLSEHHYTKLHNEIINEAAGEVITKFGATISSGWPNDHDENKIHYFLFGLIDPSKVDVQLVEQFNKAKAIPNSRVNVAMLFPATEQDSAATKIRELDTSLGVNTIYQDSVYEIEGVSYKTISKIDAADNMVCETFRVKYHAVRDASLGATKKLEESRAEAWSDVKRMQHIYENYELWHRSPYDGAFMFRTKHGWLTTATRTPKNNVQLKDMSLILNFDEKSDTITYAGDRIPSSDLPEFLVVVNRNEAALAADGNRTPVIRYMAHFHKNEITRNPTLLRYAVTFHRYGVSESGHKFADELLLNGKATDGVNIHGKGRGFIILEHGVVRLGVELDHLESFLVELMPTKKWRR